MIAVVRWVVVIGSLFVALSVNAATVVFLNPGKSTEPYWLSYTQFMQAAAADLGMNLQVLYAERKLPRMLRQARMVLNSAQPPDYLVFVNEQYAGPEILRLAKHTKVKLFAVSSTLTPDQQKLIGKSREQYPNWLGSLVPNDEEAGYIMASNLIAQGLRAKPGETLQMLAFSGDKQTPGARLRERGLWRALSEHPQVRLQQLVNSEWNRQRAYEQAQILLPRYPKVSLIWAANDEMAFGAMHAAQDLGKVPGQGLWFSALNNSVEVLQARIDDRVNVLVGGHFTAGGWALVLLHDYDAGVDFARRGGNDQQAPLFMRLDKAQSKRLLKRIKNKDYALNFRRFSAVYHPKLRSYPFSLQPLLD